MVFFEGQQGSGWGDAGRTSSGRGGASIESSDVTANSSSCGWLSTAWDHPRGGGREGRQSRASRAVQTRWPQLSCEGEKSRGADVPSVGRGRCGVKDAWDARAPAPAAGWSSRRCRTPHPSTQTPNRPSPRLPLERASVCSRDGEAIFPLDRPGLLLSERTKLLFQTLRRHNQGAALNRGGHVRGTQADGRRGCVPSGASVPAHERPGVGSRRHAHRGRWRNRIVKSTKTAREDVDPG